MHLGHIRVALAVLVLAVPAGTSRAATYYLSSNGNDDSSGTSVDEAWASLARIERAALAPGDRILLEGGATFSGNIVFDAHDCGTSKAAVILSSWGSGRATIDSGDGTAFEARNCAGMELRDLVFKGSGASNNSAAGVGFWMDLPGDGKLEHIRIDNVDISGFGDVGLYLGSNGEAWSGYRDVRITRVDIHHNGRDGLVTWGRDTTDAHAAYSHQDFYVGYSQFHHNAGHINKNEGSGVYLKGVDGAVIEYCEAYANGATGGVKGSGGPVGIWTVQSDRVVIQFNESHHNRSAGSYDGGGFGLDGGVTNSVVQYNYSHDNDGPGYQLVSGSWARPFARNVIRYNISENDARRHHGAVAIWSDAARPPTDCDIYNNTVFVGGTGSSAAVWQEFGPAASVRLFNNIFVVAAGRPLVVAHQPAGLVFLENVYFASGGAFEVVWGSVTYTSLSEWRSTGQERLFAKDVGSDSDPKLADPGSGVTIGDPTELSQLRAYELLPASPLIDGGLDLEVLFGIDPGTRDFIGSSLPQGVAYDVGARECARNAPLRPAGAMPINIESQGK